MSGQKLSWGGANFSFITNKFNTLVHKTNGISHASINKLKDSFNKAHKSQRCVLMMMECLRGDVIV